jgi:hypothetical protein
LVAKGFSGPLLVFQSFRPAENPYCQIFKSEYARFYYEYRDLSTRFELGEVRFDVDSRKRFHTP